MTKWGMCIDLNRCVGCGACVVACQLQNNQSPNVSWITLDTVEWGEEPEDSGRAFIPHACMHCEDAPCVEVCPTGASQKLEDGVVIVDYDACINCGTCMGACPYGARHSNKDGGNYFGAAEQAPYEAYGVQRSNVLEKCIFCHDRAVEEQTTACTYNCPAKARFFGDLDDPESPVSTRIAQGDAVRVDETSFYYVPARGMSQELLPSTGGAAGASAADAGASTQAPAGVDPVVATAGVAVVAAAGAAVGIGVKNSRKKKAVAAAQPAPHAADDSDQ